MSRIAVALPLLALAVILCGCGGDDIIADQTEGQQQPGAPHPDNATVTGRVVQADNPSRGLPRAIVSEPTTGRSARTSTGQGDPQEGDFELTGLPADTNLELNVAVPESSDYDSATVYVQTRRNAVTRNVFITVAPLDIGQVQAISISPRNTTLERNGSVQYEAAVMADGQIVNVQPTWVLTGQQIGSFDSTTPGLLNTTQAGSAVVKAMIGGIMAETGITVTGSSPPDISTILVSASNENPLPASGGWLYVTAGISDGDGLRHDGVTVEVYDSTGPAGTVTADRTAGTNQDGTWRARFLVEENSNKPGPDGTQAPQYYTLRLLATDNQGQTSISRWFEFAVTGLEAPPPPGSGT